MATGQFTIIDMNDITPSSTAPSSPVVDQLWLDTSVKPSVLKRYNGSTWDVVNDVQIGGRNLIRNSYIANNGCTTFTYDKPTNTWTCVAPKASSSWGYGFKIVSNNALIVERGKTLLISVEVNPSVDCTWNADVNNSYTGGTGNDNDDTSLRKNSSRNLTANVWTRCWFSYTAKSNVTYDLYDLTSNWGIVTTSAAADISFKIRNIKGEYGNTPTDWTPAPEDVEGMVDDKIKLTVKNVDVQYYLSTSSTSLAGGSWSTVAPAWVNGKYMWSKVVTTFLDLTTSESSPTCIAGATGATGATGTGISSITEEFYLSTSKTAQSGGSWVTTPPTWSVGKYMWTRSKIVYTNPASTVYTTPLCDSSWEAVNDVKVGGRNLLRNTGDFKALTYWSLSMGSGQTGVMELVDDPEHGKVIHATKTNSVSWWVLGNTPTTLPGNKFVIGRQYVLSFLAKSNVDGNVIGVNFLDGNGQNAVMTVKSIPITLTWAKYSYAFTATATGNTPQLYMTSGSISENWFTDFKLEEGNVATDWDPSPEDIQSQINVIVSDVSDVKSAVTATAIVNTVKQSTEWKQTSNAIEQMKSGTRCHNLGMKINANTFVGGTDPAGELYLHGYDADNAPSDVNGHFLFNGTPFYITKGAVNPDSNFGNGVDVYLCRNMASSSVFGAYYDSVALKWKYRFLIGTDGTTGDLDLEVTFICFGQFRMTSSEGFEYAYLYESPKVLKNAISQNIELVGKYSTKTEVTQTSNALIASFKSSGGCNLVRNSSGYNDTAMWTKSGGTIATATNNNIGGATTKMLYLDNGTNTAEIYAFSKRFKLKSSTKYTLSGWFHNYTKCPNFDLWVLASTSVGDTDTGTTYTNPIQLITLGNTNGVWVKYSVSFTTPANTLSGFIRIDNNGYNSAGTNSNRIHWSALMLNEGEEVPWSPHPSEVYDGSTIIDASGVTILNGGIQVKNNAGVTVLSGDVNGNLSISGGITSGGLNNQFGDIKVLDNSSNTIIGMNRNGIAASKIEFYNGIVMDANGVYQGGKGSWCYISGADGFYQWRVDPTGGYEHKSVKIKDGQIQLGGQTTSQNLDYNGILLSGSDLTGAIDIKTMYLWTTSNGAGTNVAIGDDVWLGDINEYATMGIKCQDNSGKAMIRFGNGGKFGYTGGTTLEMWGDLRHNGTTYGYGLNLDSFGTNGLFTGNGDQATWATCNVDLKGWWGIGVKSYDDVRRFVFDTRGGHFYATGNLSTGGQVTFTAGYGGNQRIAVQSVGVFDFYTGLNTSKYQLTQDGRLYYYKGSNATWYSIAGSSYGS